MKMLVCLHGNPLNGQEFESLLPDLQAKGFHPIIHKRPVKGSKLEPLLQSINATVKVSGGGSFGLIAYSWGAYLALCYLQRFPENVNGVLLINPLLVDRKPLKFGAKVLLHTPILRSLVLRCLSRKMASDYIDKTFFPKDTPDETRSQLQSFLAYPSIWRGAAVYKDIMRTNPLPETFPIFQNPIRVLFGARDEVAPKFEQMDVLKKLNRVSFDTIPNAGHGLPWTYREGILEEINQLFGGMS